MKPKINQKKPKSTKSVQDPTSPHSIRLASPASTEVEHVLLGCMSKSRQKHVAESPAASQRFCKVLAIREPAPLENKCRDNPGIPS
jgi:hypothetical protein